jgi:hypothetical protein
MAMFGPYEADGASRRTELVLGIVCILFFLFALIMSQQGNEKGDLKTVGIFIFFILAGFLVVVGAHGRYFVDDNGIQHYTFHGKFGILWKEIEAIEFGPYRSIAILGSNNKQFVIPSLLRWHGKRKDECMVFLENKLHESSVKISKGKFTNLKTHKNVRIKPNPVGRISGA